MSKGVRMDTPDVLAAPGTRSTTVIDPVRESSQGTSPRPKPSRQRVNRLLHLLVAAGSFAGIAILTASDQAISTGGVAHHSETLPLLMISVVATLAYLVVFAALHWLPTGYSPVRHAVSDYGVGRYAGLFSAGLYASSIGVLALAFALMRGIGAPPLAVRDLVYLLLIPLARTGMALKATNLEGERLDRSGMLHYLFAVAAFTFTYLAISGTTSFLRASDPTVWLRSPLGWIGWVIAPELALVVITMFRPLRRVFGLAERLFLLTSNLWFILVALLVIDRIA